MSLHYDPYSYTPTLQPKNAPEKRVALYMVGLGALLLGALIQIINWDKYALTVIPLEASVLLGTATAEDHGTYSKICLERKKYECALNHLQTQIRMNPENLDAKLDLGLLQFRMNDMESSVSTLTTYLEEGGTDPKAGFHLAKAHAQLNDTNKALKIYKQLLGKKNGVFQVSVTREYVQTLMKAGKWKQAKSSIERARRESLTHNAFMTAEYKMILEKIRGRNLASQ